MKKIWLLLIIGLLLSACTSSQTEAPPTTTPLPPKLTDTPLPPTETSVPTTPTPNPHAEDAINAWCESLIERDVDKALSLFSEDINIYADVIYNGLGDIEYFVKSRGLDFSCRLGAIEVNGDDFVVQWYASWNTQSDESINITCTISGIMKDDKIIQLSYDCTET